MRPSMKYRAWGWLRYSPLTLAAGSIAQLSVSLMPMRPAVSRMSSLQSHSVDGCGSSRHVARKNSRRRSLSWPTRQQMVLTENIARRILSHAIFISVDHDVNGGSVRILVPVRQVRLKKAVLDDT